MQVEDPSKYGVVVMDEAAHVERFVEKPKVSLNMTCELARLNMLSMSVYATLSDTDTGACWHLFMLP